MILPPIMRLDKLARLTAAFVLVVPCLQANPSIDQRDTHERLTGALWMQTSAEYGVACRVIYRSAEAFLKTALVDKTVTAIDAQRASEDYLSLPAVVIMDLDETVLDNTPFQAEIALARSGYDSAIWSAWVEKSEAAGVPGSVEFIKLVQSAGARVLFVTNRTKKEEPYTIENLRKIGVQTEGNGADILCADENGWTTDKEPRRMLVAQTNRVLMIVGDDLGDFVDGAKDTSENRRILANAHSAKWGNGWFLLPNCLYGSWEAALYQHKKGLPDETVLRLKWKILKGFSHHPDRTPLRTSRPRPLIPAEFP
ncbi:MAG TPA: HAD family acid phosphatase [Opitutaceae bacterium]|nr:HAD family acid phosphatase [Opitutaceae bacterium]